MSVMHVPTQTDLTSNLPIGVVAIVVLFFFLHTPERERKSVRAQAADFDFTGLFLIVRLFRAPAGLTRADRWRHYVRRFIARPR